MGFEGHSLNDMIDLVEQAQPADLESAGTALKMARDAIAAAAKELGEHIDRVDWEGEAGQAFRKWGKGLVKDTHKLSDFADAASVQIASAGAGLASVRGSMPPRDNRADPKAVEDIPTPKRVDGNAEFGAAVKAEKHRQEAINQMNRLSSFYRVSRDGMARQEPPTFSAMPNVGMPKPKETFSPGSGLPGGRAVGDSRSSMAADYGQGGESVPRADASDDARQSVPVPHTGESPRREVPLERRVGTEIDSVNTLPPQGTAQERPVLPSILSPNGPGDGQPPPLGRGPVSPVIGGPVVRPPMRGGNERALLPEQGRTGIRGPSGPGPSTGRSTLPEGGRPGPLPQGRGINGPAVPGQPIAGRGITGGTPQPRSGTTPHVRGPSATGADRAHGVVGGRSSSGPASGAAASKMSRGPVIGAEGSPASRGVGRRGAAEAGPSATRGGNGKTSQRPLGSTEGVVGTPKTRASATDGKRGFTTGGTGLVRNPSGDRRRSADREDATGRPEYLVEDEDLHLPVTRRHVPPVID